MQQHPSYVVYAICIRFVASVGLTNGYFVSETQIFERLDGEVRNVGHDFRAPVKVAQRVTRKCVQKLFG